MSTLESAGKIPNDGLKLCIDISNKKSFSPNRINSSNWGTGTGSVISSSSLYGASGFTAVGDQNESVRVIGEDPFGNTQSIIWKASSLDTVYSNSDGGWNGSGFDVDPTKMYRYSIWTKRDFMTPVTSRSGSFYLGLYTNVNTSIGKNTGLTYSNAYFYRSPNTKSIADVQPPYMGGLDVWTLVVGHVWPVGTPTASIVPASGINGLPDNYNHPDSGIWTKDGKIGNLLDLPGYGDFIWSPGTISASLRTYHYYSEDITATQSFIYPRVDLVDGTEPSIQDLLRNSDPVKNLVDNYSLNGGASSFSTSDNGSLIFSPSNKNPIMGTLSSTFSTYCTSIWFNPDTDKSPTSTGSCLFQTKGTLFSLYLGSVTGFNTDETITISTPSGVTCVNGITISSGVWHNIIINWEISKYEIYLDGVKQVTTSGTTTDAVLAYSEYITIGARWDNTGLLGSYFDGKIATISMWERPLNTSEINRVYSNGKIKMGI